MKEALKIETECVDDILLLLAHSKGLLNLQITGAMNWAPTHGDQSRLNLYYVLSIVKRVKYPARFNNIDRNYHVILYHAYHAIHCAFSRDSIYQHDQGVAAQHGTWSNGQ